MSEGANGGVSPLNQCIHIAHGERGIEMLLVCVLRYLSPHLSEPLQGPGGPMYTGVYIYIYIYIYRIDRCYVVYLRGSSTQQHRARWAQTDPSHHRTSLGEESSKRRTTSRALMLSVAGEGRQAGRQTGIQTAWQPMETPDDQRDKTAKTHRQNTP